MKQTVSAALLATSGALTACGSSNTPVGGAPPPITVGPATQQTGLATLTATPIAGTSNFLFASDGIDNASVVTDGSVTNGTLIGYKNAADDSFAFVASTGNSIAAIGVSDPLIGGLDGQLITRIGSTTIPVSGTAIYSGSYAGFLKQSNLVGAIVYGDAVLTADFTANEINGAITNRQRIDLSTLVPSPAFEVLDLETGSIDNAGGFSGSTSEGGIFGLSTTGSYSGLLTGPNAEEVAGQVDVSHDAGGAMIFETGVFVAD